jgi:acyl carrier protein
MGLDSVTGVEWIQAINRQYGTSIQSTRIYDYPSISKMANYLVKELPEQKEEIISAPLAHVQPSISKMVSYLVKELPEQKEEIIPVPLAYVQPTISVESLREELKTSLAEVLRMKPDNVDVDIEFVDMGLDSVTGVEWIQAINRQYGTSIQSTRIYDYPSISKMANYLVKELPEQKEEIIQAPLAYVQLTISVESLREELKTSLAEVLRMKPDDVDVDIEFVDMGLDSVTGVEWIQAINKQYGTSIQSTRIYDYPSINKMANYLVKELPEQKGEIIQAPPIKSIPNLSLNEILHQVKSGVLDGEQAERLFAEVMNKLV